MTKQATKTQATKPATARQLGNAVARSQKAQQAAKTAQQAAQAAAQAASPMPTAAAPVVPSMAPAQAPAAPRGLPVAVRLNPASKGYRTTAPHCQQRWQALLDAMRAGGGTVQVAPLVGACTQGAAAHNYNGPGVPSHFVGYCLRRGYIVEA